MHAIVAGDSRDSEMPEEANEMQHDCMKNPFAGDTNDCTGSTADVKIACIGMRRTSVFKNLLCQSNGQEPAAPWRSA